MPEMTPELQTAYNEWMIKFGFREVDANTVIEANTILHNSTTSYKDWKRCVIYTDDTTIYRLRTLEEIETYDKNINNS